MDNLLILLNIIETISLFMIQYAAKIPSPTGTSYLDPVTGYRFQIFPVVNIEALERSSAILSKNMPFRQGLFLFGE